MGRFAVVVVVLLTACGHKSTAISDARGTGTDGVVGGGDGGDQQGCGGLPNCYSVYAHSNDVLYVVDLMAKTLVRVGPFNPPNGESMTDLAVAPDNTIYVISASSLYTASPTDGHVTRVGSLSTCGSFGVALTTLPDGRIFMGDYQGAICEIDISTAQPTVKPPVMMKNQMALSGDMVAVADGTVFGTAYDLSNGPTQSDILVTIDVATGAVVQKGATGYPNLYGTSYAESGVIGFTHDGSGRVVKLDPATGAGTLFQTFVDPMTQQPISFAGAGVNSLVPIIQ
jgi:hypothetical protein